MRSQKIGLAFIAVLFGQVFTLAQTEGLTLDPVFNDIENPVVTGRKKVEAHTFAIPYATTGQAFENIWGDSPYYRSLNGSWKFNWVENIGERPLDFYRPDFNSDGWDQIAVPSNWELQGYGI
nr:glycoside hydrolase family 2 [Bacteroidota bacterium]